MSNVGVSALEKGLNLGANKNYKTSIIQERWENQRAIWLNPNTHANNKNGPNDPRDKIPARSLPQDHKLKSWNNDGTSVRKRIKQTMRSV